MGISTDAEIAYGIDFGEDILAPWGEIDMPTAEWDAFCDAFSEDHDKWLAEQLGKELADKLELLTHCSYSNAMYILAIKGTHLSASRGYPEKLPNNLEYRPEWGVLLKEACAKLKSEAKEPSWLLFAIWEA